MWRFLGLRRLHWTRVVALLTLAPIVGVAVAKLAPFRTFPGIVWVAVAIVVSYLAGVGIGLVALAVSLGVAAAIGLHPNPHLTVAGVIAGFVVAALTGAFVSSAFDRVQVARRAAVEGEERFRRLLDSAFDAVLLSVDGVIVQTNGGLERLGGLEPGSLVGRELLGLVRPQSLEAARTFMETRATGPIEVVVSAGEGQPEHIVEVYAQNVMFEGSPARLAAIDDVTEVRRAATERAGAEARYRALFDSRAVAVTMATIEGIYIEANAVFCSIVGLSRDEVVGRHFTEFVPPGEGGDPEVLHAILRGDEGPFNFDTHLVDAAGARIPVHVSIGLVRDDDGEPLYTVGVLQSIAEQRRLEEQLRQTQKMEAIGQLAGGIAHDFNNLLTVIGGNVMLIGSGELSDEAREYAGEISAAAERAGALTRQLLTFSRKQEVRLRAVDVNRVVEDVEQLLLRLLGTSVEIELVLDADAPHALADAQQLEQVLINLAVNARDAMPRGGRLTIVTMEADGAVLLRVADTGHGMDDLTRERIFEPFFTTKDPGEGTGLGLSTVYGIVRQAGGDIRVESEPGEGATFTVSLPAAAGFEEHDPTAAARPIAARAGRVLLVDDEAGVRKVAGRALTRAGHELIVAGSGQEALDVLDDGRPIDLLITDLAMPGMNGIELAEHVRARHPHVPVLYISGYSDEVLATVHTTNTALDVLEKPFTPAVLAARVADVLGQRRSDD